MPIKVRQDVKVPEDLDPFPFGKHKGTPYQDVPVKYIHYAHHNFTGAHMEPVHAYIYKNLQALMEEDEDLI